MKEEVGLPIQRLPSIQRWKRQFAALLEMKVCCLKDGWFWEEEEDEDKIFFEQGSYFWAHRESCMVPSYNSNMSCAAIYDTIVCFGDSLTSFGLADSGFVSRLQSRYDRRLEGEWDSSLNLRRIFPHSSFNIIDLLTLSIHSYSFNQSYVEVSVATQPEKLARSLLDFSFRTLPTMVE